jgi:hypothetical protein
VGLELVPGHDVNYHLISYDARGREREERDGPYSAVVLHEAVQLRPTDVFVLSHGWQGDIPAAREQYGRWIGAMLSCPDGRARLVNRPVGFRPLLVGVHWPSKAWGDEELGPSSFDVTDEPAQDTDYSDDTDALIDRYAERLGDSPSIRQAVATIVSHTLEDAAPLRLPEPVRLAYEIIDAEVSMGDAGGEGAPPGEDREPFDAEATYQACQLEEIVSFGGGSLGGLLAPLRMLTFWHMKRRARDFGETGAAKLLDDVQTAVPAARIHLMGHSFGCIVTSAAIAGAADRRLRPPVASLVLAQGAMSLWSFCSAIPSRPRHAGYFHRLVADKLVAGPILTTTSLHDRAVRAFYPIGAGVRRQVDYDDELPTYGGIGVWGVRGPGIKITSDDAIPEGGKAYDLRPGAVLNLDATEVIKNGDGASGAHNDICHLEIAQAVWQVVYAAGRERVSSPLE